MIKALKVTMIVYGALGILFGLAYIFAHRQVGAMFGFEPGPNYVAHILAALGASFIAACVFLIAAARDPLRHIYWVKFAILFAVLMVVVELYTVIQGYVDFSQASMGVILHAIFAVALLVFYPWRAARSGE